MRHNAVVESIVARDGGSKCRRSRRHAARSETFDFGEETSSLALLLRPFFGR